jgi:HAE1 family hydrophobic/amphiphilic exporter-1
LVIAQGAGAITRHAVGTPVFGGMIAASAFGIFLIPPLFMTAERLRRWNWLGSVPRRERKKRSSETAPSPAE